MRILTTAAFAVAALSLGCPASAAGSAPPDADAIVRSSGAALGTARLASLRSFHFRAKGTGAGLSGTADSWADRTTGAVAVYSKLGPISQDLGFDGREQWTRDAKGVVWVDGSVGGHGSAVNEAFRDTYALWTPGYGGATVTADGEKTDGGVTYDVLTITPRGSAVPFTLWIDSTTNLPARYVETSQGTTTTGTLSNYHDVNGVRFPFTQATASDDGNTFSFTVDSADANPSDAAAHVRKPASTVSDFTIHGANQTSVPIDLIDNHVYLSVMLNGKGPYRFIFDTWRLKHHRPRGRQGDRRNLGRKPSRERRRIRDRGIFIRERHFVAGR